MNLGITGRRALVCAASKGLGRGCAEALAREGADVTILARTRADVERAPAEISAVAGRLLIDDDDENWWVTSVTEGVVPGAWRLV